MPHILPDVLKRLRLAKGWSLEQLADRTKPKINKQTIHRIEKGPPRNTRDSTLGQLAKALSVPPAVLTGQEQLPESLDDDGGYFLMSKLGFRISTQACNAMFLVGDRYNVTHQEIVELAPFLFCWAAEKSLQQRRDHLRQVELACETAQILESEIRHLGATDFTNSEEKIAAEKESIEQRDLFGLSLDEYSNPNDWTTNPFAVFLASLTEDIGEGASFEGYSFRDFPDYRICAEDAALFSDGDPELADHILQGHVALNGMPKELHDFGKYKERAEWARGRVDEFRKDMLSRIGRSKREEVST
jgi:transcriptional regulator with XRE-family HTH domain